MYVGAMGNANDREHKGITLTVAARNALAEKVSDELTCLRVGIKGGGCSGFQYQLALDHKRDDDLVFEDGETRIVVSPDAISYLDGSEIDFVDDIMASGFNVNNPNATSACGCGSSFRVDNSASCYG